MNSEKENLWKILKGELTLPEMMRYFGRTEANISLVLSELKSVDINDTLYCFALAHHLTRKAYDKLYELGEIDTTQIFNMATASIDGVPQFGDMGICGENVYIYKDDAWQQLTN